jgi:hypothetical protein
MMMKGPTREFFPVGEQVVTIAVPEGRRVAGARLMVSGRDAAFEPGPEGARITVPGIELIEVLHVRWA